MFDRSLFKTLTPRDACAIVHVPPVAPLPILGDQRPILLVFDHRDPAIELAYERTPLVDGTRVRPTTRDTTAYWVPRLTPVFAVSDGLIVYARAHADGYAIAIEHAGGWVTVSHRLEHLFVAPSERDLARCTHVAAGDVLGYLAPSDRAPLLPLRFELYRRIGGELEPVDPLRHIRRWRELRWDERADWRL